MCNSGDSNRTVTTCWTSLTAYITWAPSAGTSHSVCFCAGSSSLSVYPKASNRLAR